MLSKDSVHVLELVAGIQQRPLVHIINAGQHIIKLPDNTFKDEAGLSSHKVKAFALHAERGPASSIMKTTLGSSEEL